MKKYDLVFVISDLGSGGAQRVLINMIKSWSKENKCIAVITLSEKTTDFFSLQKTIDRYTISGINYSSNLISAILLNIRRILKLRKLLKKLNPKIVIGFICPTNILTILATRKLNVRLIISERNDPAKQSFGWVWDALRKKLYQNADIVTTNSKGALTTLANYVPRERLRFVPNPITTFSKSSNIQFNKPTILTVGRLHFQKAYDILLPAFANFLKKFPDWELAVIGDGPLRQSLTMQANALNIIKQVKWYGTVQDPFPYYCAAQIFVLASRHEGTPNALLEAMSCKLPVIVSNASPGPLEYVTHNVSGLVVEAENVNALAEAFCRLATDEAASERFTKNAFEKLQLNTSDNVMQIWNSILV